MRRPLQRSIVLFVILSVAVPVMADRLAGSNEFLCSVSLATRCYADGECETGLPWIWNIPEFIEVDLDAKRLSTTEASEQRRTTPIKNLERSEGQIFLQGVERGRAFSIVIAEETGWASFAVATGESTVSAFGACTPTPTKR